MAYTFTVNKTYSVSSYQIILSSFTYLRVKEISTGNIVYQTLLSGKPAIRVVGTNYEIGTFSTSDPIFERKIDLSLNPHSLEVVQSGSDYCCIGVTNEDGNSVTYTYKINLCPVELWKSGNNIYLRSPYCAGQSGCGNCFSES